MRKVFQQIILPIAVISFITGVIGIATYLAGTTAIQPAQTPQAIRPFVFPTSRPIESPAIAYFRLEPRLAVLLSAPQPTLPALEDIQALSRYLPQTGDTLTELQPPTPLPTPLPFPTAPPLPQPAQLTPLPTFEPLQVTDGQRPFGGDVCAPSGYPVAGALTQRYHAFHPGIDLAAPLGTPVLATHSGTVVYADWSEEGYGNLVVLQNGLFLTYYGHNLRNNVTVGDKVGKDSIIAWSGSTGNSSGPHVHYEVHINNAPYDPIAFNERGYPAC